VRLVLLALLLWALSLVNVFLRYTLAAGGLTLLTRFLPHRRLQQRLASPADRRREMLWSFSTMLIFTTIAAPMLLANRLGWTQMYQEIDTYGHAYLGVSFMLALIIHDAYFYWTHRLLHLRPFRRFHGVHHQSTTPTAWALIAFHPVEAVIQAGIYPILLFLLPMHVGVLTAFMLYSAVFAAVIHCGHDLGGRGPILFSARQHDSHHAQGYGNYGLYFSFWDRLMGTTASETERPEALVYNS
jgi:Delta7-sterol 5-desaturase